MIISKNGMKGIGNLDFNDIYIVTDFDGTLTVSSSDSSWASIFKNPNVSEEFVQECIRIFKKYHPIEIDDNIPIDEKTKVMNEWYRVNIETLVNYGITEDMINYSAQNKSIMAFRDGAREFLQLLNDFGVPVIVISAGVGNIIKQFLIRENCDFPNIFICSNFLKYEDNKVVGVEDDNLIHSLNKSEVSLPEKIKSLIKGKTPVLLGDNVMDIHMLNQKDKAIKIGFLDEKVEERKESFLNNFDLVCIGDVSFKELLDSTKDNKK